MTFFINPFSNIVAANLKEINPFMDYIYEDITRVVDWVNKRWWVLSNFTYVNTYSPNEIDPSNATLTLIDFNPVTANTPISITLPPNLPRLQIIGGVAQSFRVTPTGIAYTTVNSHARSILRNIATQVPSTPTSDFDITTVSSVGGTGLGFDITVNGSALSLSWTTIPEPPRPPDPIDIRTEHITIIKTNGAASVTNYTELRDEGDFYLTQNTRYADRLDPLSYTYVYQSTIITNQDTTSTSSEVYDPNLNTTTLSGSSATIFETSYLQTYLEGNIPTSYVIGGIYSRSSTTNGNPVGVQVDAASSPLHSIDVGLFVGTPTASIYTLYQTTGGGLAGLDLLAHVSRVDAQRDMGFGIKAQNTTWVSLTTLDGSTSPPIRVAIDGGLLTDYNNGLNGTRSSFFMWAFLSPMDGRTYTFRSNLSPSPELYWLLYNKAPPSNSTMAMPVIPITSYALNTPYRFSTF